MYIILRYRVDYYFLPVRRYASAGSYGRVSVSVTSRCSIETAEWSWFFCIGASFHLSHPVLKKVNSRIFASNTRNLVQNSGLRENFATAGLLIVEKFHVCECNHKFCCEIDVINLKDTRRIVLFQICQNKIFWQLLSVTAGL